MSVTLAFMHAYMQFHCTCSHVPAHALFLHQGFIRLSTARWTTHSAANELSIVRNNVVI